MSYFLFQQLFKNKVDRTYKQSNIKISLISVINIVICYREAEGAKESKMCMLSKSLLSGMGPAPQHELRTVSEESKAQSSFPGSI